jgi:outer membrane protein TolC
MVMFLCSSLASAQGKPVEAVEPAPVEGPIPSDEAPSPVPPGPPPDTELGFELPHVSAGQPMTLEQALARTDGRNPGLAAARIEIEKAEAQLKQAYGLVLPAAQASMQLMHRDHADTVNFTDSLPEEMIPEGMGTGDMVVMPQQDLKGSIGVAMPIVNVQNWLTIGSAKQGVRVAEASIEDARQQILLGVAIAYHVARQVGNLIALQEQQVRSAAHHLQIARARFAVGTGLRIDVIRAETDLEQARQELLKAHLGYDNARDALGTLTGAGGLPLPVDPPQLNAPDGDDDELVSQALAERSSIRAKREMVELMDRQLDAAWMQLLPTLDAAWGLDYQFTEPGELGSTDRSRWALIFTLTVPIYNHYRYGDLDHKRASLRQAMLQQEDAEQNLSQQVRQLRRDYLTALSSVEIAENQARLAAEALTLVEAAYEVGTGASLDVTDARRTKSAADVNLVTQRLQAQIGLLNLLSAVGRDMNQLGE